MARQRVGFEVFDPATQAWTTGESLPLPRAGAATVVWNESAYVIGGAESLDVVMTPTVLALSALGSSP